MFRRILIANRGEVAVRIARTCDKLGVEPVFVCSTADSKSPYLQGRNYVVIGPPSPADSYLNADALVQAAVQSRCSAIHPGWGFLAESPRFAALCEQYGISFIGPKPHAMRLMGQKIPAKQAMKAAGLDVVPGSDGIVANAASAQGIADEIGYPVLIKAQSGGGGRGMRIVRSASEVKEKFDDATGEARAAFGDPGVYIEKLIQGGRHIEIQILADKYGNVVHLGERDCSVQRNHQKLIEESPAIALSDEQRDQVCSLAAKAARDIGYIGAGTMEFLYDDGVMRFIEMNTRLQVEHPVSELRSGVDLVAEQLRVASGKPLTISQGDIKLKGHAIECRINAEDPSDGFKPSPGLIEKWHAPGDGKRIRIDTHVESGYKVPPFYDSLICKVIVYGDDRKAAIKIMLEALDKLTCEGVKTTVPMHKAILGSTEFQENNYDTQAIPGWGG